MIPGDVVHDRFEIERLAGSGGMGTVYRARDRATDKRVAFKVLKGHDREERERFAREATALAELSHPGIVEYVAHGRTPGGDPFLVMEWLDGETLSDVLRWKRLTVAQTLTVAVRIAEALSAMHQKGVLHRDLKPSNLLIVEGDLERIKILDFGIVRIADASTQITATGAMLGTPGYMAPEQARGVKDIDTRADVFALGCVLFKCLTGNAPFGGSDVLAVLLKVVLEDAPRASDLCPEVPQALDELVARMLSKSPADRPADGAAVLEELRAFAHLRSTEPATRATVTRAELTATERRVVCLVLARVSDTGSDPIPSERIAGKWPLADDKTTATIWSVPVPSSPSSHIDRTIPSSVAQDRAIADVVVEQFQGELEALADGSLLVTFHSAGAATDLAARAARCALAVQALLGGVPTVLVTGRGVTSAPVPIGEIIDRGVKLLAQPGSPPPSADAAAAEIRIDELTAGLIGPRFDVTGDARGLVLRGERKELDDARTLLGKRTPCVGRDREIAALSSYFEECVSEPMARVALVTGCAGVGKSRIRHELVRKIRDAQSSPPVEIWIARGDPMSAGAPFGMLAQIVRRTAGVLEGEPLGVRQQKLRARLGLHLSGEALDRVVVFISELVGDPFPDDASLELRSSRYDPIVLGDQMRRAWEDWLAAESAAQPVAIVLEDLQWGDVPTIRFIDAALRHLAESALFVLALARPEIHDAFPKLWSERDLQEIRVGELTKKGCERLIREVLGDRVDDATVARLVERAAGNAFYLEELIRAVADGKGDELPETVLAMAQARIERLEPEARRVLRAASVFGQVFWRDGIAALLGGEGRVGYVGQWLDVLVNLEVITRRPQCRFSDADAEYVFRHALVRDAAYAMLTEADRALGHRLAAAWLESVGERTDVVLAEHFERGGEPKRAVTWYVRAAEQALGGNDLEAAIARAQRGVECEASGQNLGLLQLHAAEARRWRGEFAEAEACASRALEALEPGSGPWHRALGEVAIASGRLGLHKRMAPLVRQLLDRGDQGDTSAAHVIALAQTAGVLLFAGRRDLADSLLERIDAIEAELTQHDPEVLAWVDRARGTRVLLDGDPGSCLALMESAAQRFERAGDLRSASGQRINVGYAYLAVGAYREAEKALREALASARRMNLHNAAATAQHNLGMALGRQNLLDEACAVENEAIEAAQRQGDRRMEGAARTYLAVLLGLAEKFELAEQEARAAVEILTVSPPTRAYALAVLAHALLAQNRSDDAVEPARQAMDLLNELGALEEGETLVRLAYARALLLTAKHDEGRAALAAVRDRLLARAATIRDPRWRESFLKRVPENASTLALVEGWLQEPH